MLLYSPQLIAGSVRRGESGKGEQSDQVGQKRCDHPVKIALTPRGPVPLANIP
jgi:hypothetical protein